MSLIIRSVEVFQVRYPTRGRFKFFESLDGKPLGRPAVLIKITANDGTFGWGEAVPIEKWSYETLETATSTIRHYFTPALIGMDAADIEGIHQVLNKLIAPGFSTGMPKAKAGIDIALHDLVCKHQHLSLAEYWGKSQGNPPRKPLTISWTLNPLKLDDVDRLIDEGLEKGYENFNVKVAPDPDFDIALCKKMKERVPNGFLWADANCGYTVETALSVVPKLADIGVAVIESPFRPNEISSYQRLKKQGALPVIMDEGIVNIRELQEFIQLEMLDGVAMKPARCAGLLQSKQQIEMVQDRGLMFLGSGLTDPDVSLAAMLALYSAFDLQYPAALNGPQFLDHSVIKKPLVPVDGKLTPPDGPGLGVEVDMDLVNEIVVNVGSS